MDEEEWPLPVRTVCDTPDAILEAIRTLKEWGEAVIVEHEGKRVAAIIPMDDLELYQRLFADEEDRVDSAKVDEIIERAGGYDAFRANTVPWEEVKRRLAI
jgi:hypothetical protein